MKTCPRCKQPLKLDQFSDHTYRKDGKQAWCRACMSEHKKIILERKRQDFWYKSKNLNIVRW